MGDEVERLRAEVERLRARVDVLEGAMRRAVDLIIADDAERAARVLEDALEGDEP